MKHTDPLSDFYEENGYLVIDDVLSQQELAAVRRVTDEFEARARSATESDDVFDLGEAHTAAAPHLRRVKSPHKHHAVYRDLLAHPRILDVITKLITPNIRLYGTKLNTKPAGHGEAVEWHQDWAYYPHTNDDVLNVGIMLDDVDDANGPLLVVPGSHRGPVFDHHYDGHFCGAMDPAVRGIDLTKAEALTGKAGSITVHHVRAVHASAPNTSPHPRRLLLHIYAAADAWPLVGCGAPGGRSCAGADYTEYDARMICGQSTSEPRMIALPVRLPLPPAGDGSSIFTAQAESGYRYFGSDSEPGDRQAELARHAST